MFSDSFYVVVDICVKFDIVGVIVMLIFVKKMVLEYCLSFWIYFLWWVNFFGLGFLIVLVRGIGFVCLILIVVDLRLWINKYDCCGKKNVEWCGW